MLVCLNLEVLAWYSLEMWVYYTRVVLRDDIMSVVSAS